MSSTALPPETSVLEDIDALTQGIKEEEEEQERQRVHKEKKSKLGEMRTALEAREAVLADIRDPAKIDERKKQNAALKKRAAKFLKRTEAMDPRVVELMDDVKDYVVEGRELHRDAQLLGYGMSDRFRDGKYLAWVLIRRLSENWPREFTRLQHKMSRGNVADGVRGEILVREKDPGAVARPE